MRIWDTAVRETFEEAGPAIAPRRVSGERVHPDSKRRITYVACNALAGTPCVADTGELDAVEWVPVSEPGSYVPNGFYGPGPPT